MPPTPTIIFEEHHEAFVAWYHAIEQGWLAKQGNLLFHVDSHDDMESPRLRRPLPSSGLELDQIDRFAIENLGIAKFIIPAAFLGWLKSIYWLHPDGTVDTPASKCHLAIRHDESEGLWFKRQFLRKISWSPIFQRHTKIVLAAHFDLSLAEAKMAMVADSHSAAPLILDIDLDFFSCNLVPNPQPYRVEITQKQYETFHSNRYHSFNILSDGQFRLIKNDGRYFLLGGDEEISHGPLRRSREQILRRMDQFENALGCLREQPQLIDICRSRISGFTPTDQWEFIESELLARLDARYGLQVKHLCDVLRSESLAKDTKDALDPLHAGEIAEP